LLHAGKVDVGELAILLILAVLSGWEEKAIVCFHCHPVEFYEKKCMELYC
jgi:hypothetical protein